MPPKAKITQDMVINAAFEVAREGGGENINARTVEMCIRDRLCGGSWRLTVKKWNFVKFN